ncbi:40S ribosomal protein S6 [Paramarasmius palmivorus]|uniref:40S ribosomal protein S6 n=1 Tax=Paramarasmius palmivorus TaxID=297713 RepID=A0AAW0EC91_9AGAR
MYAIPSKGSPIDVGSMAISEAPDNSLTAMIVVALFGLALLLHRYLRCLYPCITVIEMNKAEALLDDAFSDATQNDYLRGFEQELINQNRLRVKNTSSEIRTQSLQTPASIWKKCFDVEVELFSDIIAWYARMDEIQREISTIVELEKRYRYNIQLGGRVMLATNV